MNMELESRLETLVAATCDLLVEMDKAPPISDLNDEEVIEHWREQWKMRASAVSWGIASRDLSEDCIRVIINNSDPDETKEIREVWIAGGGARTGSNQRDIIMDHRDELTQLLTQVNGKLSSANADRIIGRLDRSSGLDDWKFRGVVMHVDDAGAYGDSSRRGIINFGYGRITREAVVQFTEELIELYDSVRGETPGKTTLVRLMEKYHAEERNPQRHRAWFVVKRLRHLDWTKYVNTENMNGANGLISAVKHDNLATVVGNGGLGKTALVYEFIRRNYDDQTRANSAHVKPFEEVILFSTKSAEQGEYNTYDGSGGTLEPNVDGVSGMDYMPPGSYQDFIDTICSLDTNRERDYVESREDQALRILRNQNVLIVLDNYEDIERDEEYSADKERYEEFLVDRWRKMLVEQPNGRVIMTSRTGLQKYSRSGIVKMENLDSVQSKEFLKQRYLWLFDRQGGSPSSRVLEEVLDADSRTFDQILEKEKMFREILWGHPLVIQLFAVVLKEEESNGGTGAEILNRVMGRFRDSELTQEVLQYITKKTEKMLFSDEKGSHLFEILLRTKEMTTIQRLLAETDEVLEITHADIRDFKDKLDGVGYLEYSVLPDGSQEFWISPRERDRVMLTRGEAFDEPDADEDFESIEESENWQKYFQAQAIREDKVSATNYRDHKTLERICRRLLGEDTGARLGLDSDIRRVSRTGLSNRRMLLFENMILADEIVGKFTEEEIGKHGEKVVQEIEELDREVSRTMFRFVRDLGKEDIAWESVTEPNNRQIRQVISRLAINPDWDEANVKEDIALFIDGLHGIVHRWSPVGDISRNHQFDEILNSWGKHLSDLDDEILNSWGEPLEIRSWWIEIAWILWGSDVGLNFHLLGLMLSNYLLDQEELDQEAGDAERYSEMLREMQQHPLFCDYADLSRFAEEMVGEEFHLDDEDEIKMLNQALPGDILCIPDEEWTRSKMGSYEELRKGGQTINRDIIDSETRGGRWLLTKRDSFGMKVELHEADMPSEVPPTESSLEEPITYNVEPEEIVNWCEDILKGLDDYMATSYLGGQISEKLGRRVSVYLREFGESKFTDFLLHSRLGPRLHFRGTEGYPRHDVKLLGDSNDVGRQTKQQRMPNNPSHTARCIEVLSNQLAINSQWQPHVVAKEVRKILISEGVNQQTNKLRILAWAITVGSYKRSEKIKTNGGSEIDVSPEKLLDQHYNYLMGLQLHTPPENKASEDELANWKEGVEEHLTQTGERLVALPKIKKIDYESSTVPKLKAMCKERGIKRYSKLKKAELIGRLKESPSD